MSKKALLVTRVSGFIPQFEMNNVKILQEMGYEVHYAANFNTVVYGKDNSRLEGTGITCHHIEFCRSPFSRQVLDAIKALEKLMEEENFDLIHCHMPMTGVVTRIAAERTRKKTKQKVPVLYTAHGLHFYKGAPLKNWIYYPVERYLARWTDGLILINKEDYARAKRFPVRGEVYHTKGIGMNLHKFEPYVSKANVPEKTVYETYGIPEESKIIISVGELTKRKNNIVILKALEKLKATPVHYIMCGTGPMEEKLREKVKELGIEGNVHFAGYVSEVPQVLVQADAFVFPSLQEGLPVAVMEAMAMGVPVIATRIRGITDLITDEKGGYILPDWDEKNYAMAIKKLLFLDDEESRKKMGQANMEKIKEFSISGVEATMRKIYGKYCKGE